MKYYLIHSNLAFHSIIAQIIRRTLETVALFKTHLQKKKKNKRKKSCKYIYKTDFTFIAWE